MRSTVLKALGLSIVLLVGTTLLAHVGPAAPFIVDDDNHVVSVVALRLGGFQVPGTEGIRPSRELFWFDPLGSSRASDARAVATLPPLYALIAQPFALLGWRGLIGLQSLSFLLTLGLLAWVERRRLRDPRIVGIAVVTLALGGYLFEYAIALWPHMLSMALTMFAFVLASEGLGGQKERLGLRLGAGLAVGLAVGVRYQNITYAFGIGMGLLLLSSSRIRESAAFTLGLLPPLLFNTLVNRSRLGTFNPITKGRTYLALGLGREGWLGSVVDAFKSRIIDSSMTPPWSLARQPWWSQDAVTGAVLHHGVIKKAWLQSIPWVTLPLLTMLQSWLSPRDKALGVRSGEGSEEIGATAGDVALRRAQKADLRLSALIALSVLGTILGFGVGRHDGLCFNQRYFIDLLPLFVHGLAVSLDRLEDPRLGRRLILGGSVGIVFIFFVMVALPADSMMRLLLLLRVPLVLGVLLVGLFLLPSRWRSLLPLVLGVAIAWAAGAHFLGDVRESLATRWRHHEEVRLLAKALPKGQPVALFAYWGNKDALGPLVLTRDLVVADAHNDGGATAPDLIHDFLARGRRVFVIINGHSEALLRKMGEGLKIVSYEVLRVRGKRHWFLVELRRF